LKYQIVPLLAFFGYFIIFLIMLRGEKTKINRVFTLYIAVVLFWSFGAFMMRTGLPPSALFWNRILTTGFITAPFAFYHFSLVYSEKSLVFKKLALSYSIAAMLVVANFAGALVTSATFINGEFHYELGAFAPALAFFAVLYALVATLNIYQKDFKGVKPKKNKVVLTGALIYTISSFLNFFPSIGKYPIDLIGSFLFAIFITYCICRHGFLRNLSYVKTTIFYGLVSGAISTIFYFAITLLNEYLETTYVYIIVSAIGLISGIFFFFFQKVKIELIESEKRFRLLAENARDIIYRYNFYPEEKLEYISPAVRIITGYDQEDFYKSPNLIDNLLGVEVLKKINDFILLPESDVKPIELQIRSKDNRPIWLEGHFIPFYDKNKRLLAVEGIIRDISERKTVEQEMSRLNQLHILGQTAATIAHEIRNPMTTASGFLQVLRGKAELNSYQDWINLVIEEINRANHIITEYLSFSKESQGEHRKEDLSEIIQSIFPLMESDAVAGTKRIELNLTSDIKLFVNSKEIKQLIHNLVRNGLEAMDRGGILRIETYLAPGHVVLKVQDQGSGIETEVLEKLGTPFFSTKEEGTGLGLAVCYQIAGKHGAKITVETGSGGTTFFVTFNSCD